MNTELLLKNVRLSFSDDLVVAKATAEGKPRFTAALIVEKGSPEFALCQKAVEEISKAEFSGVIPAGDRCCWRDGATMIDKKTEEVRTGYDGGQWYVAGARALKRGAPIVIDRKKNPVVPGDRYFPEAGDHVNAKVNFFSMNGKNDKGGDVSWGKKICCEIQVVQYWAEGEKFASSVNIDDMPEGENEDDDILG